MSQLYYPGGDMCSLITPLQDTLTGENSVKDTQSISVLFLHVDYNYLDEIFLNKCSESMHFESGTPVFEC